MTNVLILGGTGWLSGAVARRWRDAGASVTCLARGSRPVPPGTELVAADRADPDAYARVGGRDWDEVVDISSDPDHVAAAVGALAPRTGHWTYVSSVSAYAGNDEIGADEGAALSVPAAPGTLDDEYDYSRAKVAAEASVRSVWGERAAIVRPGLIVGPGDPTDRFGYWVGRFALAAKGAVLAPPLEGARAQVIDVEDLADFVVGRGMDGWHGTANAVGESMPLGDLLALARQVAGHAGQVVEADEEWLTARGIAPWMGPRSLPLWLPPGMPGFMTRSNTAYLAAGGRLRSLRDTLERTLADERARGLDRERRAGLSRTDELELIAALYA
jgi:nucleoside-diphosphate-sugar epimerase